MSDEGDAADDAAGDGSAVVTKAVARPQRPTGKRTRARAVEAPEEDDDDSTEVVLTKKQPAKKDAAKDTAKTKSTPKAKPKKPKKAGASSSANPLMFVYNYIKQVVAEMRKVIWPNRKQMLTYTSVVLAFLAFMVALVAGADLGLSKLVLMVFG
ncbi:preprotein translocase subunit SecE [Mycobacterium asiaticum]|uniref:Protein translocase subunit SecE n=1 Tax=Mycobacterium asiaticum TaxID=1790 RepID=A0A1A3PEK1_MYCAS|nr:preprotein translocase subunit SecE [Mycobacterium asiaticum]OBK31719.1 preprotein translocase subunit SecE [Mycobacterium asiaticum]